MQFCVGIVSLFRFLYVLWINGLLCYYDVWINGVIMYYKCYVVKKFFYVFEGVVMYIEIVFIFFYIVLEMLDFLS